MVRPTASGPTRAAVAALLHELYIEAPGAGLREEDEKKVDEVHALLGELGRILPRSRDVTLVDIGAGLSLVGFAAVLLSAPLRRARLHYIGVEREPGHVERCRAIAARHGVSDFEARNGDARSVPLPMRPDLVLALHACGDATDHAIARAIELQARHVLILPCCHRRPDWSGLDRLGIPRQAALRGPIVQGLIDSARALELEAAGYEITALELVPASVTPKNLLLRGRRIGEPRRASAAARQLARLRAALS